MFFWGEGKVVPSYFQKTFLLPESTVNSSIKISYLLPLTFVHLNLKRKNRELHMLLILKRILHALLKDLHVYHTYPISTKTLWVLLDILVNRLTTM